MLHGHTKIELKNEKTNEIQVIEKDNMITNGLINLFSQIPYMYTISSAQNQNLLTNYLPLNNKAMGGLLLFQETLEEDINNIVIPKNSDNPIIGYASNDVNSSSDIKRGSRNLTESVELNNGYKFVWDFTTSQANGKISSIALTHSDTAANPLGMNIVDCAHSRLISRDSTLGDYLNHITDFDWHSNIIRCIKTIDTTHINIIKIKINVNNIISINNNIGSISIISQTTKELSTSLTNTSVYWHSSDDDYYYGMSCDGYYSNSPMYLYRISKLDYSLDTSFTFTWRTDHGYIYSSDSKFVHNNIMYFGGNSNFKIDLNTKKASMLQGQCSTMVFDSFRNIFHAGTVFITEDDSTVSRNSNKNFFYTGTDGDYERGAFIDSIHRKVFSINISTNPVYIYFNIGMLKDYLATINNLDTPVIKTSEQSMKITYTITEE